MKTYKYVVIGGGLAGGRAIEGIRESDANGSIALVAEEPHRPYQRPPLSKGYLIGAQSESEVYVAEADRYDDAAITLLTGVRAERIDRAARTITLDDDRTLGYEILLLATGGRAKTLPIPGHDLGDVFTLRTIEDSDRIRAASGAGKHALVLGAGFIGSEVAASLAMRDTQVTMAFPEPRLLARIAPEEMSAWLRGLYAEEGILILSGITPDELLGTETVKGARLSDGSQIGLDMVVMGVGIDLNTALAVDAGLDIREDDRAVIVNEYLQTSDPHIYAAGDIAAWPDPTFKKHLRVEHWDVAFNQGYVAGRNMAGSKQVYDTLPYFFSDIFDVSYEVWGDLSRWDRTVRRGDLADRSVAFYYFDKDELVGVLAMGRPDEERTPMQDLVKAKAAYEEIAAYLADEDYNLADLL